MPPLASSYLWSPTMLLPVVSLVACLWAAFWLIRLAVRYGVNDALRNNRSWLQAQSDERDHSSSSRQV